MKIELIPRVEKGDKLEYGVIYEKDDGVILVYQGENNSCYIYSSDNNGAADISPADKDSINHHTWFKSNKQVVISN